MSKDLTWPADRMAKFIDVTPRHLRRLVVDGTVPREDRGRYNPFLVTVSYIRYLRDRAESPELSDSEFRAERLAKIRAERQSLELDMEITRKERIPIDVVTAVNNEVDMAIAGILKSSVGKVLTHELINEIFSQFRNIPESLGWETQPVSEPPR
jgi:phage terminase Nu1 subunit (DNA packaging protein)